MSLKRPPATTWKAKPPGVQSISPTPFLPSDGVPSVHGVVLWKHIDPADFRDSSGRYYTSATDLAIVYPLLELAGGRVEMVEEFLYV